MLKVKQFQILKKQASKNNNTILSLMWLDFPTYLLIQPMKYHRGGCVSRRVTNRCHYVMMWRTFLQMKCICQICQMQPSWDFYFKWLSFQHLSRSMVGPYLMVLLSSQFRKHCQVCCQNCRMCENTMLLLQALRYEWWSWKERVSEDHSFYDGIARPL